MDTKPLLLITWNLIHLHTQKVRFCFALVNLWSHLRNEIPYPALFLWRISHPHPIKTRNPATARICNSRFPPLFPAQIPNITAKKKAKSRVPRVNPITPWLVCYRRQRTNKWNLYKVVVQQIYYCLLIEKNKRYWAFIWTLEILILWISVFSKPSTFEKKYDVRVWWNCSLNSLAHFPKEEGLMLRLVLNQMRPWKTFTISGYCLGEPRDG